MSKKGSVKLGSNDRGIVINRTSTSIPHQRLSMGGAGLGGGSFSMSSRMSMGGGNITLPAGSASSVTSEHIRGVKDRNQMEKKAFQECNMKLAKKVEREKFLVAQNKILLEELNILRGKKNLDRTDIEKDCLQELEAYKEKVENAIKEKAESFARIANLEDQVNDVNKLNETQEGDIAARIKQIERLNTQMGDMEGENATLRRTIGTHEDEIKRLKLIIEEFKQNVADCRVNLEDECKQRIETEMALNLAMDERDFTIAILEKEIDELKKCLNTDVGQLDIKNLWKGEITSCIKQLQEDNDAELTKIKAEYQTRFDSQMRQMNAGQMKDNANLVKLQSEIERLKSKNVDQGPLIAELNAKVLALTHERNGLTDAFADATDSWEEEKRQHLKDIATLQQQLNELLERFEDLQDVKMTLETEISTYRRLLEGEEDSMDRFVTNSSGARSPGADKLNDLVQTSSTMGYINQSSSSSMSGGGFGGGSGSGFGGGSGSGFGGGSGSGFGGGSGGGFGGGSGSGFSGSSGSGFSGGMGFEDGVQMQMSSSGMGGASQLSSSEGKVFIKKKASGPLCIEEAQGSGAFVTLCYGTKEKKPSATKAAQPLKPMNLEGWKVIRCMEGDNDPCAVFEFRDEYIMHPAAKMKIFGAKYSKDANIKNGDLVAPFQTWKSGGGKFALIDKTKTEKGFLTIEFK
ncbi:retrograde protein of 51 kDa-like isoform X2 [Pecten maximus]|uniref:retrograde protein of 51 kDa-like isoform X2 n=1 Tax=Pecten maximus TaxID=6579 RepID=UPI001458BF12|nr:retrograde protein of 51 kDa-like isoform X2 [Pecten maximus]